MPTSRQRRPKKPSGLAEKPLQKRRIGAWSFSLGFVTPESEKGEGRGEKGEMKGVKDDNHQA